MRNRRKNPDVREQERLYKISYMKRPDVRDRDNQRRRERYRTDLVHREKIKEQVRRNQLGYNQKPEVKQYHSEYSKVWWKNNPEKKLEYFITYYGKLGKLFKLSPKQTHVMLSLWSRAVRKRDLNICVYCGSTTNLEAHHQYPKAIYPELMFDLNNGVTACIDCHRELTRQANHL